MKPSKDKSDLTAIDAIKLVRRRFKRHIKNLKELAQTYREDGAMYTAIGVDVKAKLMEDALGIVEGVVTEYAEKLK